MFIVPIPGHPWLTALIYMGIPIIIIAAIHYHDKKKEKSP
jgi:hypothetical protein